MDPGGVGERRWSQEDKNALFICTGFSKIIYII